MAEAGPGAAILGPAFLFGACAKAAKEKSGPRIQGRLSDNRRILERDPQGRIGPMTMIRIFADGAMVTVGLVDTLRCLQQIAQFFLVIVLIQYISTIVDPIYFRFSSIPVFEHVPCIDHETGAILAIGS